jgi:twin arginine-targeting protein translocase TatB
MGFAELLVIAVVGLIVIGPARLPETLRTIALWTGRLKRMASNLYKEVEKEVGMDDIKRQLHNENIMSQLKLDDINSIKDAYHSKGSSGNKPGSGQSEKPPKDDSNSGKD